MAKILLILLCWFMLALPAGAQDIVFKKVAVFPFTVFSKEPLPQLDARIPQIIRASLEQEGFGIVPEDELLKAIPPRQELTDATAADIARKLGADIVMLGSLVKVGPTVTLEARLQDLTGKMPPATLKMEGMGVSAVTGLAEKLAAEAGYKIMGQERVAKIDVKGNRRIEKDAILASLQTREGDLTSPVKLRDDLKAVYRLGYFSDVKIDVTDSPQGRIVTFVVVEKPAIQDIILQGNRKIKEKKIKEVMDIKPFAIASDAAINDNINKIRALYRNKGFYNADVNYRLDEITPSEVNLVININEGGKIYVRDIRFEGNHAFKPKKLKDVIDTKEKSLLTFITSAGILKPEELERDAEKIAAFYFNNGYIKAKVGEPRVDIGARGMTVTFPIEEGPQFKVGTVNIQGDLLEPEEKLRAKLDIIKEKIYSREVVQKDLTTLSDFYADHGYALADVTPLLKEDDETLTVSITFDIRQGEKVYFERIEIAGNVKTRDKVIRRELRVYEQELFSATNIKRSTQNLRRLEFFEDVNFSTSPGTAPHKMNLKINVKERPTGSFGLGGGYSTQDKVVGMIEISQSNLFGRGQQLKAQGVIGAVAKRYRLSFVEPYLFDRPLSLGIDGYNWEREFDEYTRKSRGGNINLSHPLRWEYTRLYGSYRFENVDLKDLATDISPVLQEAATIHNISAASITLRRDSRDALFTPTRGSDNSVSVELAGLGGDVAYTRFVADSGWYFPLFWGTVGVLHGRIGYMLANPWGKLPAYENFYLGGIDSIRGYKYAEISPRDPIYNDRIGGTKFIQTNTEFRFPLYKKLGLTGVVFFDAGQVYADNVSYFTSMKTSVGTGIRWYSPMGPLRVEWGYNLNPYSGGRRSNWEFSVGGVW